MRSPRLSWLPNYHSGTMLVLLLAICFLFYPLSAQEQSHPPAQKNFLWSVQSTHNVVYLLGSVHVLKQEAYPLNTAIENAYRHSHTVVFETDMDGLNNPVVQTKMLTSGQYPAAQTLKQHVSAQTYTLLQDRVTAAGLPMAQFDQLQPWLCALTLAVTELTRLGFQPQYGIDSYFFEKTRQDGKARLFLETVEEQIHLFSEMDQQHQESFLRQTLKDLDLIETMATDMIRAWQHGDVARLDTLLTMSLKNVPALHERLLTDRNKKWLTKIEDLMQHHDNVLVIVGAGHLVGAEGLVGLLRQRGYTIEQR